MAIRLISLYCLLLTSLQGQSVPTGFSQRSPRYRLQPSDVIEVLYRYTPEYNQSVTVQPDGFITLQLISGLRVEGLTLDEAASAIVERESKILNRPVVSVSLKEYEKSHFVVGGQVKNPGRFELRGKTSVLEAIAMAGGFDNASAKISQVLLFRRINTDTAETKILNLKHTMSARAAEQNITLQSGDLLIVPQNKISKIERYLKLVNLGLYYNPASPL